MPTALIPSFDEAQREATGPMPSTMVERYFMTDDFAQVVSNARTDFVLRPARLAMR